jgi:aminoglycoside phosphotransferase family enzyme/predicted kinase
MRIDEPSSELNGRAMSRVLRDASTYRRSPFHSKPPLVSPPQLVETHISWIALAGSIAYKIKKPVRYDFLDYATLERRREACEVELELNRRWAPELYLGLSALARTDDGVFFDVDGDVVDYAVRMHRFNREDELDQLIARHEVEPEAIVTLARAIADQHRLAPIAPQPVDATLNVRHAAEQNLEWLRGNCADARVQSLSDWTSRQWSAVEAVLNRRRALGHVRECHGDLHSGNVVRLANRLMPFDGIDFDARLRWIDVASDIAFLVMDLECRGRPDLAMSCLNAWLERSADYEAGACLRFFLVYRALVRAKIALLRRAQIAGPSASAARDEAVKYIGQADAWKDRAALALVLMHGFSGSGKSVLAAGLVPELPAITLRADVVRRRVAVADADDANAPGLNRGLYSPANTDRTYQALLAAASGLLGAGCTVVVDATFLARQRRDHFRSLGSRAGVPVIIVDCQAPMAVLRERIAGRKNDPSEATHAVLEQQLSSGDRLDDAERRTAVVARTDAQTWPGEIAEQIRSLSCDP